MPTANGGKPAAAEPRGAPPPSPRGAPPQSPAGGGARPPAAQSGASFSSGKGKREKRVRSATRKRGARGQGGKAKPKKKVETKKPPPPAAAVQPAAAVRPAAASATPLPLPGALPSANVSMGAPVQPAGAMQLGAPGVPMTPQSPPKKRKRERKNRHPGHWKPWSEQTWEERLEREKYQERRAAEREAQQAMPLSKSQKKKRRNEFVIPRAPRNTTQALMHGGVAMPDGGQNGDLAPSPMPSMQGLLSRSSFAHQENRCESESSDSDSDDGADDGGTGAGGRSNGVRTNGVAKAAVRPPRPPSPPPSQPGTPGSPLRHAGAGADAAMGVDMAALLDEKDQRIRELEAQNQRLCARLEALEARVSAQV